MPWKLLNTNLMGKQGALSKLVKKQIMHISKWSAVHGPERGICSTCLWQKLLSAGILAILISFSTTPRLRANPPSTLHNRWAKGVSWLFLCACQTLLTSVIFTNSFYCCIPSCLDATVFRLQSKEVYIGFVPYIWILWLSLYTVRLDANRATRVTLKWGK